MDISNITIGWAFLAGLASFLSPCVFSLVPAYVGYLGGRAAGGEATGSSRWVTFSHGLAFVLGFSVVFVTLGVAASALGSVLYDLRTWLAKIGGVVVILFGLHMIGVFRIPFLEYDIRVHSLPDRKLGYLSSALMGVFFSAGWSPCVGPVLGAILTLAFNGGDLTVGTTLLSAYSAGLGIPFLVAALGIGWVSTILKKYSKTMRYVEIAMGVILVIVGIMLFAGTFELLARYGLWVDFGL
ncbi:MAG: cytochrome c biogenesis protein CcdA [Chloroflexota bacterium]